MSIYPEYKVRFSVLVVCKACGHKDNQEFEYGFHSAKEALVFALSVFVNGDTLISVDQ